MKGASAAAAADNGNSMKCKKLICILACMTLLLAVGCHSNNGEEPIEPTYEVVTADLGDTASYGGMTLTVVSVEDPDITLDNGKKAIFFQVTLDNQTEETVAASYLNNFSLTVNGVDYDSDKCCSIPAMRALYDTYGINAINEELAPGASCTGYVACEVDERFDLIGLHYTPKTTDRGSRITVTVTVNDMITSTTAAE